MQFGAKILGLSFKPVDIVFVSLFIGLLVAILVFYIIHKIGEKKTAKAIQEEFERLEGLDKQNEAALSSAVLEPAVADVKKNDNLAEAKEPEEVKENLVVEEETQEAKALTEENVNESNPVSNECPQDVQENDTVNPEAEDKNVEVLEETKEETVVEKSKRQYNGKYEIYQENEYFRYRLKASNGEILFVSELYTSRDGALKSIGAVQRNLEKGKIEIFADKRKNYKFQLKAANHRVLVISANYSSNQGAVNASESFKRFAMTEDIVDVELPQEELNDSSLIEIAKVKEEDKNGGKFFLRKDTHGVFSWELKASNGEILCQADGYSTKASLETSINSFKSSVKNGKFFIYADKNERYQFKLYSQTGRLSMVGESYSTSQQAQSVVTSILNFLDLAVLVDKTVAPVKKTAPATKKAPAKKPAAKKTATK